MATDAITVEVVGDVGVVRMDDGRVNAFTDDSVQDLRQALSTAATSSMAIVLTGRPGYLCAGLDRRVILGEDRDKVRALLHSVTSLYEELLTLPVPTVAACTGHAVAAGALLLLCCDYRLAATGPARVGLTEVAAGVPLFPLAVAVARTRLSGGQFVTSLLEGRALSIPEAQAMGYVDDICLAGELEERAVATAARLAALDRVAFLTSRQLLWAPAQEEVRRAVAARQRPTPG
ncbi:MAG TPA: enoyl-CoA hydratase-related protein [Jatrophihabitantaceae bacterium]|jgi:enoyl-CoA hydratase